MSIVRLLFAAFLAAHGWSAQCPPQEVAALTLPGNVPNDNFGRSIAVSGNTVVVGAPWYWGSATASVAPGAAFVYERDPLDAHAWTLSHSFVPGTAVFSYGWEVAIEGDLIAIACGESTGWMSNVVHVHQRNVGGPNAWGQVATLTNDLYPGGNSDHFGRGLAIDGDTIAVGAPYLTGAASVYVFGRNVGGADAWGQVRRIVAPFQTSLITDFGRALDLDGDTLLVGAARNPSHDGSAYIFARNLGGADQWGLEKTLLPPQIANDGEMGFAVALDGNRALVGLPTWGSGRVLAYRRFANGWFYVGQTIEPIGGSTPNRFGAAITLDGARALIGCPYESIGGAAYAFEAVGSGTTTWEQTARLVASDAMASEQLGIDVALVGKLAFTGNLRNANTLPALGKVPVFDLETAAAPISYCTSGTSIAGCVGRIVGVGTPSASDADGFELVIVDIDAQRSVAPFYGVSGAMTGPIPGSQSWRCVAPPRQRLGVHVSTGTSGACDGTLRVDWNTFRATHPNALGSPFAAGQTISAQAWWRDPAAPAGGASTQGLQFSLCP